MSAGDVMFHFDEAFNDVAGGVSQARTIAGLTGVAAHIGFDHVAVAYTQSATRGQSVTAVTTYPQAWINDCASLPERMILLDPILQRLTTQVRPVVWDQRTYVAAKSGQLYDAFSAYGLGSGMAVNVRGAHGDSLSLGFTCGATYARPDSQLLPELGALCLAATAAYHAFARMLEPAAPEPTVKLTQRELELLRWSRCGKTAWESGNILGISQATATFHLKNAVQKLGVASKQQAVLRAMELRLIS
jgi:DNA-binding CsgD family transcriptional regulator